MSKDCAVKIGAVIQARMGSTRLPGKVLRDLGGKPMLLFIADRIGASRHDLKVAVSTSLDERDDAIEAFCQTQGINCFRGPVDDIISRLHAAASGLDCTHLVRLWGDCPFVCHDVVDQALDRMFENGQEFVSTDRVGTRNLPYGLDFEIYSRGLIESLHREVVEPKMREFPVEFVLSQTEPAHIGLAHGVADGTRWFLAVDYPEDMVAAQKLAAALTAMAQPARYESLLAVAQSRPDLLGGFSHQARNIEYKAFQATLKQGSTHG